MEMRRQDFSFDLPQELIAQDPLKDRAGSRLLVLDKETGAVSHHVFREIKEYLHPGDCLVLNDGDLLLAIEKFVRDEHIDILAFSTYRRNILARMFSPSLARRMLFHTNTPLLVMHAKN